MTEFIIFLCCTWVNRPILNENGIPQIMDLINVFFFEKIFYSEGGKKTIKNKSWATTQKLLNDNI